MDLTDGRAFGMTLRVLTVTKVDDDSLAFKAGVRIGDKILKVNDAVVHTSDEFATQWTNSKNQGKKFTLVVLSV